MILIAASIYWVIVPLWLTVLGTLLVYYIRNPSVFGATRLLLMVIAIDTFRNIIENIYFGVYFGGQYGLFPAAVVPVLGNPVLLIIPKILNVIAGCVVLGLLLMRWLPSAVRERMKSDQTAGDLKNLVAIDVLTGLYNRQHFHALGRAEWARFERYLHPLSILVLDIDQFKAIDDRLGHDAGDAVVKSIASACANARRASDIVGRIDAHEFAILLPHTSAAEARLVAEQLRDLARNCLPVFDGESLILTLSIGVATSTLSMSGIETLIQRADGALYNAKRSGSNRVATAAADHSEHPQVAAE